ncbi:hypothetical protein [Actinomadura sp. 3N508]|uniref:hypothetical protein n=1 Tax=Actinomadura sp. 3N508 TaxID=3375153 RepID=UPI0037A58873
MDRLEAELLGAVHEAEPVGRCSRSPLAAWSLRRRWPHAALTSDTWGSGRCG